MKLATSDVLPPDLVYKGHRIVVSRVGRGWRANVYAPGADKALRGKPGLAGGVPEGGYRRGG
jgi:hypothetical protein